jgi:hypothetical protein
MTWLIVTFGALSASGWFGAAVITPDFSKSYYGGLPPPIALRAKIGWVLNAGGALFAALAIGLQAWATAIAGAP